MSLYFTIGRPFPGQIAPSHGGSQSPSNTWFLGPTRVLNPNCILIGSAVFAGLTIVTDRQTDRPTDHATRYVTIDRINVRRTAIRPNNNCNQKTSDFNSVRIDHARPHRPVYEPCTGHTSRTGLNIQHAPGVSCMDYCCPFSPL